MTNFIRAVLTASLVAVSGLSHTTAFAGEYKAEKSYTLEVTNLTKGIAFTPLLAASHSPAISLFEVGMPASEAVERVAEGGDIAPLMMALSDSSKVFTTSQSEGLLMPGASTEIMISAKGYYKKLSLIAMLLPTNDGLVALNGAQLPRHKNHSKTYFMYAYDGGTEMNDELCASIPGPQCGGEPFSPEDDGEGYIYPHPGIHGESELTRMEYQWSGPVAKVVVTRVH